MVIKIFVKNTLCLWYHYNENDNLKAKIKPSKDMCIKRPDDYYQMFINFSK